MIEIAPDPSLFALVALFGFSWLMVHTNLLGRGILYILVILASIYVINVAVNAGGLPLLNVISVNSYDNSTGAYAYQSQAILLPLEVLVLVLFAIHTISALKVTNAIVDKMRG